MFYNLKTKLHCYANKRNKFIFIFVVIVITIIVSVFMVAKNKEVDEPVIEEIIKEMDLVSKDVKNDETVYGEDVKNKYKEIKGSDFTILVTTIEFLKTKGLEESKEYYRYALENGDSNQISLIQITDDEYMDAIFINYNRVLKDSVVIKDISGGYVATNGFSEEEGDMFHKYTESKSIRIKDQAIFKEYPIYDEYYKLIGILYVELFDNY